MEDKEKKPPMNKMVVTTASGAGLGPIVVWAWNGLVPDYQMEGEMVAAVGPVVGAIVAYLICWLPKP